jgi:hypothetical protein
VANDRFAQMGFVAGGNVRGAVELKSPNTPTGVPVQ